MLRFAFSTLTSAIRDRRGVTALEYGVIAGAIVVASVTAFTALKGKLTTMLNGIAF